MAKRINVKPTTTLYDLKKKIRQSTKAVKSDSVVTERLHYKFAEYLVNCEDAIEKNMRPAEGRVYRLAHNPHLPIDSLPTSLWEHKTLTPKKVDIHETIPEGSSIEDQEEQLREFLPSFNRSIDGAIAPFVDRFKSMSDEKQKKFLLKKGNTVYAYDLIKQDGRLWEESDGHVLLQPFENFKLEEHIAKDVEPILFTDLLK